jgi:hypothetical protein
VSVLERHPTWEVPRSILEESRRKVHRDVYRRAVVEPRALTRKLASDAGVSDVIDWTRADAMVATREGVARDVARVPVVP